MVPILTRLFTLAAKVEASYGAQATMSNTDAVFRVLGPMIKQVGTSVVIPAGSGLADIGAVSGMYSGSLPFAMELYGNSPSWPGIFLPSCGFVLTATSGRYQVCDVVAATATSNAWASITAGQWFGANHAAGIYGAMGSVNFTLAANSPFIANFNYRGAYTSTPGSLPTNVSYETTRPPVFNNFSVDNVSGIAVPNVRITMGDDVFLIPQPNTTGGVLHAFRRKPEIIVEFEPLRVASDALESDWLMNGTHSFTATAGTTGNMITIGGIFTQQEAPDLGERDELLTSPLRYRVLNNSLYVTVG